MAQDAASSTTVMRPLRWLALLTCAPDAFGLVPGPWSDRELPPEHRAQALRKAMTLEEKLLLLHGPDLPGQCGDKPECAYVGNIAGVPRLGIPPINMQDGPQGFRNKGDAATSTAWPSGMAMAATWDEAAVFSWGSNMGREFYEKGANVQLGPGLCIARVPLNGRNFEYLSGEDPYLGYRLAQPAIRGIQSNKVVANAKHWVLNNQETNRRAVSAEADERTRFEMYYPPFEGAIEAGVGSYMCGYNKINGEWSCENPVTLKHDLKTVLGFKGYVMSDWGATHSTSLGAGLDVEQPRAEFMNATAIKALLDAGSVDVSAVDDAVERIFWSMFSVGVMDEPNDAWNRDKLQTNVSTPASFAAARHLSAVSTVMLKNEGGALPLEERGTIALIGFVDKGAIFHGGGSGRVMPSKTVTPADGIRAAVGDRAKVLVDEGIDISAAAALAKSADRAVVFVGTLSSEGVDRTSLSLDSGCSSKQDAQCSGNANKQNKLIDAIAEANPRTIVVASIPGAVLMPWSKKVSAILTNFMPGQEAGNAIADVLFGKVNPSAKLPITIPNMENELNFSQAQYPGVPDPAVPEKAFYSEKLLVGYRYYDTHAINFTSGFPFGHGLSYTTFSYSDLALSGRELSFIIKNEGRVAGADVAQLYLGFPDGAGEPLKQLKGFNKTRILAPGELQSVSMLLRPRDLSVWCPQAHHWKLVLGIYKVFVGSSSRDIRLQGSFHLHQSGELVQLLGMAQQAAATLVV